MPTEYLSGIAYRLFYANNDINYKLFVYMSNEVFSVAPEPKHTDVAQFPSQRPNPHWAVFFSYGGLQ